ncbi:MAG: OmpH family outer membrane protein [Phycisphaerae bacterium]
MKKNVSYLFMFVVVMAAVVWFAGSGNAAQKNSPMPTKAAVVDIVKVFNDYQRTKEINERLNKEQVELQNQRKQKIDRVEALKAQLDSLHPDSKDYYQREKELLERSIELKNFTDIKAEEIKREFRVMTEDIYGEMLKTIESVAKDAGYDLVLYLDLTDIHGDNFPALLEKIRERKVLYSTKEIDITQNVLEALNQNYKLKGSSSSESPKSEETPLKSGKTRRK